MTLEKAIAIATKAHSGQKDKAGQPYILHPLRLLLRMNTEDERMAAVLHDVVEDTRGKPNQIAMQDLGALGLQGSALEAVRLLTKDEETDYKIEANLMTYLGAIKPNSIARKVKIADLEDNLNVLRLNEVTEKDRVRLDRYLVAHRFLNG